MEVLWCDVYSLTFTSCRELDNHGSFMFEEKQRGSDRSNGVWHAHVDVNQR